MQQDEQQCGDGSNGFVDAEVATGTGATPESGSDVAPEPSPTDASGGVPADAAEERSRKLARNLSVAALVVELACLVLGFVVPLVGFVLYALGGFAGGVIAIVAWKTPVEGKRGGMLVASSVIAVALLALFVLKCVMFVTGVEFVAGVAADAFTMHVAPMLGI